MFLLRDRVEIQKTSSSSFDNYDKQKIVKRMREKKPDGMRENHLVDFIFKMNEYFTQQKELIILKRIQSIVACFLIK